MIVILIEIEGSIVNEIHFIGINQANLIWLGVTNRHAINMIRSKSISTINATLLHIKAETWHQNLTLHFFAELMPDTRHLNKTKAVRSMNILLSWIHSKRLLPGTPETGGFQCCMSASR
jgi:hypothetical protein